ncbi:MAG: SCO family protein [Desulfocapsaceae bacterium]|nr:SCO family protein [Desulfocapsaceae bacterium]
MRWSGVILLVLFASLLCFFSIGIAEEQKRQNNTGDQEVGQSLEMGDPQLNTLWVDEQNGQYLPLEAVFNDESGLPLTLGEIIDKPTLLLPIYFYCPSSCSLNLMNLANSVKRSSLKPGKDFKIIAFSFNEEEDEENARVAKRNYLRLLPDDFPEDNWKFLTGSKENIDKVTEAIGYQFKPIEDGTFIHPSALVVAAEDGMIIKYVYGSFVTGDVDMAILEAQKGTPGVSVKRLLAYCFNYDPEKSRTFFQNVKIGGLIGFGVLGLLFFAYVRKAGKNKNSSSKRSQHEH